MGHADGCVARPSRPSSWRCCRGRSRPAEGPSGSRGRRGQGCRPTRTRSCRRSSASRPCSVHALASLHCCAILSTLDSTCCVQKASWVAGVLASPHPRNSFVYRPGRVLDDETGRAALAAFGREGKAPAVRARDDERDRAVGSVAVTDDDGLDEVADVLAPLREVPLVGGPVGRRPVDLTGGVERPEVRRPGEWVGIRRAHYGDLQDGVAGVHLRRRELDVRGVDVRFRRHTELREPKTDMVVLAQREHREVEHRGGLGGRLRDIVRPGLEEVLVRDRRPRRYRRIRRSRVRRFGRSG